MSFLENLEGVGERMLEGFFRGRGQTLQPVEIAKKLLREMERQKTVSVKSVYAPNFYLVRLSPADWETLAPFGRALGRELEQYVEEQAGERNFALLGPVSVSLELEEGLARGEARVHAHLEEERQGGAGQQENLSGDTITFNRQNTGALGWRLKVVEGPDSGRVFTIGERAVLGRGSGADINLEDNGVSRQHALLEERLGALFVVDLGSTNGTLINGERVKRKKLGAGDRLQVGQTQLELKVD